MKNQFHFYFLFILTVLISFSLSACAGTSTIQLPDSVNTPVLLTTTLTVKNTATPSPTIASTPVVTATFLPSPTSTPQSHSVKLGETLGGIALQYRVSLDKILEINPEVNPNAMIVGMTILIPAETQVPGNQTPFPTAITLPVTGLNCLPDAEKGIWCFGFIQNITETIMESVIVSVNLADQQASSVHSQKAVVPLNVIFPDEKIPFSVYLSPEMPNPFQSSAQFSSSIPLDADVNQFKRIEITDLQFTPSNSKITKVTGNFQLPEDASTVWVVAIALNDSGEIIGLRRWESSDPNPGSFEIDLYAVADQIASVQAFAEALP